MAAFWNIFFSLYTGSEKSISYRRYVIRPDGHRFDQKYIIKNIRFCSKSISICGPIKGDGSKILIRCPTLLDSTAYQVVLEEGLQDMYADDSVFMQDGAPCHTSRSTVLYLEKKKFVFLVIGHHSHLTSMSLKTYDPFLRHVYSIQYHVIQ